MCLDILLIRIASVGGKNTNSVPGKENLQDKFFLTLFFYCPLAKFRGEKSNADTIYNS